ncbi:MAG: hypothetical protein HWE18_09330 [Gammaproteobacteria bacterium]|nr:hypothetical protein [Gammaproteobacteria bacterium]
MKNTHLALIFALGISPCFAAELESSNIKGLPFSYMDVEKNCVAERNGQQSVAIECKGAQMRSVNRSCSGYISGGLESAKLNCGGALWVLNQKCRIHMLDAQQGEISCTI